MMYVWGCAKAGVRKYSEGISCFWAPEFCCFTAWKQFFSIGVHEDGNVSLCFHWLFLSWGCSCSVFLKGFWVSGGCRCFCFPLAVAGLWWFGGCRRWAAGVWLCRCRCRWGDFWGICRVRELSLSLSLSLSRSLSLCLAALDWDKLSLSHSLSLSLTLSLSLWQRLIRTSSLSLSGWQRFDWDQAARVIGSVWFALLWFYCKCCGKHMVKFWKSTNNLLICKSSHSCWIKDTYISLKH